MIGSLFTIDFLERGVRETAAYRALDATFADTKAALTALYSAFPVSMQPNEAETEARLIYPICDVLGWGFRSAQQGLDAKRRSVPDAYLFLDDGDRQRADFEARQEDKVRHADVILEAKRWNVPFDRRFDRETPPMAQLLAYLSRAETQSNRRVRWGILTDGRKWRLCFQGAKSLLTDYLEVDIPVLLSVPGVETDLFSQRPQDPDHWFKVFLLFFRAMDSGLGPTGGPSIKAHLTKAAFGKRGSRAISRPRFSQRSIPGCFEP